MGGLPPATAGGRRDDVLTTPQSIRSATDVHFAGDRLRVGAPERHWRDAELHLRVTLPTGSGLTTRTASAEVACSGRLTSFGGTTASSEITLGDVERDVTVKTASGDLAAGMVGGAVRVAGASGDVAVEGAGGGVDVDLASGDVHVGEAGGSVRVHTKSGDVRIGRASAGRVTLDSASGDLCIGVAAGVGARLDVTSVSGDLSCDLPFEETSRPDAPLEIVCRTASGDVHIEAAAT